MSEDPKQIRGIWKKCGTVVLVAGLAIVAYGVVGFWLINTLPPNGGDQGRLPSVYVMGAGIVVAVIGLAVRDTRAGRTAQEGVRKEIPTSYGILGLLAILIILFLVIARM